MQLLNCSDRGRKRERIDVTRFAKEQEGYHVQTFSIYIGTIHLKKNLFHTVTVTSSWFKAGRKRGRSGACC
jgi:hypothetical protein